MRFHYCQWKLKDSKGFYKDSAPLSPGFSLPSAIAPLDLLLNSFNI